jgi:hypothetical protein
MFGEAAKLAGAITTGTISVGRAIRGALSLSCEQVSLERALLGGSRTCDVL